MYKRSIFILSTLLILFLTSVSTFSQTYGEIFTKEEANKRFGPVLRSVTLQTSVFQRLLNQTDNYVMFRIEGGNAIILDSKRRALHPAGRSVNSADVFSVYSVSVMNKLLNLGASADLIVEQRSSVLSISNGGYTLEVGVFCPPWCPDEDGY